MIAMSALAGATSLAGDQLAAGAKLAAALWQLGHRPEGTCSACEALDAAVTSGLYEPPEPATPPAPPDGPRHAAPPRRYRRLPAAFRTGKW